MATKKSSAKKQKKKTSTKPNKEPIAKENTVNPVDHQLHKQPWLIALGVVILIFAILMVPVEYQARESYIEIETYEVRTQQVVPDYDNPVEMRVCNQAPAEVRMEVDPFSPYVDPVGFNYECKASFRVWNQEDESGKWTYTYTFTIGDKVITTSPVTKEIPKSSAVTFSFSSTECEKDDNVEGYYTLVSSPTVESCTYETTYPNKTVVNVEEKQREVPKERIVSKQERLWEKMFGVNEKA